MITSCRHNVGYLRDLDIHKGGACRVIYETLVRTCSIPANANASIFGKKGLNLTIFVIFLQNRGFRNIFMIFERGFRRSL